MVGAPGGTLGYLFLKLSQEGHPQLILLYCYLLIAAVHCPARLRVALVYE